MSTKFKHIFTKIRTTLLVFLTLFITLSSAIQHEQESSDDDITAVAQDITIQLGENGKASIEASQINDGSTVANGKITFTLDKYDFTCDDIVYFENKFQSITVTLTVTDEAGNTETAQSQVTVEDRIGPVITLTEMLVTYTELGTTFTLDLNKEPKDNCANAPQQTFSIEDPAECTTISKTATIFAFDDYGNRTTSILDADVTDNIPPTVITQDLDVYLDNNGQFTILKNNIDNGSFDDCGIATITIDTNEFTCADLGENQVTLEVTDIHNNISSGTAAVNVFDTIKPILGLQPYILVLNASGNGILSFSDVDDSSSDNCSIESSTLSNSIFNCSHVGTQTIAVEIFDKSGNKRSGSIDIKVVDSTKPILTTTNITRSLNTKDSVTISVSDIDLGSTDACGIDTQILSDTSFSCSQLGENKITYTVTDHNSNVATKIIIVTITDIEFPNVITQNISRNLDILGNATITASNINDGSSDNCSIRSTSLSKQNFDCSNLGNNTVTLTVTDDGGNESTQTAIVEIIDNIQPILELEDITVQLDSFGNYELNISDLVVTDLDNCTTTLTTSQTTSFYCENIGENSIEITSTDKSGNQTIRTAKVIIKDTIRPTVNVNDNLVFVLNQDGNISITAEEINDSSNDNCSTNTIAISQTDFDCSMTGKQIINFTVNDKSNNETIVPVTVMIKDTTAPVAIGNPINVILNENGLASVRPSEIENGSTDNCAIAHTLSTLSLSTFDCSMTAGKDIIFTVSDTSENINSTSISINVEDNIFPTLELQDLTVQLDKNGDYYFNISDLVITNYDNCITTTLVTETTSFNCESIGENLVEITSTDNSGNQTTRTAIVTVQDSIAPTPKVNDNLELILNKDGNIIFTAEQINKGSIDNCSINTITISQTDFDCSMTGNRSINFTVTDKSSNQTIIPINVIVKDTTEPIAAGRSFEVFLDETGNLEITTSDLEINSTDNCSIDHTRSTISRSDFDCSMIGPNNVTYTVIDESGNENSTTVIITVTDTIAPILNFLDQTVQLDTNGDLILSANILTTNSSDNCTDISYSFSQTNFNCSHLGKMDLTITGTDGNRNSSSQTIKLTVEDTIAPTAITQPLTKQLNLNGETTITANDIIQQMTDNTGTCNIPILKKLSQEIFTCEHIGENKITLTLTDLSGNFSTYTTTVTIEDLTAPTVTTKDIVVNLNTNGEASITPEDINNNSSDNCTIERMTVSPNTFNCNDVSVLVTLTVWDKNGNFATNTGTVQVQENNLPQVIAKETSTFNLDNEGTITIQPKELENGSISTCNLLKFSLDKTTFTCNDIGTIQNLTLTGTTPSGLSDSQPTIVHIEDNDKPFIIPLQDLNKSVDANSCYKTLTLTRPTVIDNSDVCRTSPITATHNHIGQFEIGSTIVTWTATDNYGNTQTFDQTVTVKDTIYPKVICNKAITYELSNDECEGKLLVPKPTNVSDNCDLKNLTFSFQDLNNSNFSGYGDADNTYPSGTTTLQWTITDMSGYQAFCQQKITVREDIKPFFTNCPEKTIVSCDKTVNYNTLEAEDNCSNTLTITQTKGLASGSIFPIGTSTLSFIATDGSGNQSEVCTFKIDISAIPEIILERNSYELVYGEQVEIPVEYKNISSTPIWTPEDLILEGIGLIIFTPTTPFDTVLTITGMSPQQCPAKEKITFKYTINLSIPTAFTPNDDGVNDKWEIENIVFYPQAEITIFSRMGKELYKGNNIQEWDGTYNGKIQPIGPYYYVIDLKNGMAPLKGTISIIR
jgi:gliding motility-associated-like protein